MIDIVECFRKSEDILPVAEQAVAIGARCLWMQLGIVNEHAARWPEGRHDGRDGPLHENRAPGCTRS